ncbi:MAG: Tn3 family transposase [Rhodanobacteraceae bacterium]|nr:MAG: Tn3 family transposase [Rhodanobacteraceae bacterium]
MSHWNQPYLGLAAFPADLSTFELDYFFTFKPDELDALKTRYKPLLRIGAAIQLGFLKMTGCPLSTLKVIPRQLLQHVGTQLDEAAPSIASLRSLYKKRKRTLYEHQAWAVEMLHLNDLSPRQERMLYARMREMARTSASLDLLVQFAKEWLYERALLMPSSRRLRDAARRALTGVEDDLFKAVAAEIPQPIRDRWLQELVGEPSRGGLATVHWLDQGPKRGVRKGLGEEFRKLDYLRELGVPDYPIDAISIEKQRFYARRFRRRRPSRLVDLRDPRRTLELASFLRCALTRVTDAILHMTRQRAADLMREARDEAAQQDARSALTYREAIQAIRDLVDNEAMDAAAVREQIRAVLTQLKPKAYQSRAAATRDRLMEKSPAIRALLHSVVTLPIEGTESESVCESINILRDVYAENGTALGPDAKPRVKRMWREQVEASDRAQALRALEAATMLEFRQALRRGTVWVKDSFEFRDREKIFIDHERWQKDRHRHYLRLRVPERAEEFYRPLVANLEAGLASVAASLDAGNLAVSGDTLRLPPIAPEVLPEGLAATRTQLFREIGEIQLPELLLEMDSQVHFSQALLGRPAQSERELLTLYGACIALGSELDASGVAMMTPPLEATQILTAMRGLEDERAFRRANEGTVEFIRRHGITKFWGEGTTASSDMMSLEASRHLWRARVDPRRRVPAIGVYQHILDQWGVVYDLPIVLMNRQAGAAIEGVIRQTTADIERLSVDTHGYTDFGMGIAKLLGFDLCPRLKNLRERRLYLPAGVDIPKQLECVVERDISLRAIQVGWDDLVRVAASINDGTTSAVLALERYGSAARGDKTLGAGAHLGRMLRTIFLCDYYTNPTFRRELHRILNHGESLHALERAIYTGRMSPARGRRPEEMVAVSGALTLLTNLVMGWTTWRAQTVVDGWKSEHPRRLGDDALSELLAHTAPVHFGNINFRGTFRFPIERYRDRLLIPSTQSRLSVAG